MGRKTAKETRPTIPLADVAHHEAGHVVAAFYMHSRISRATILADAESAGHVQHNIRHLGEIEFRDTPAAQRRVENSALISLAGPAAQHKFNPCGVRVHHGDADRRAAIAVLSHLTSGGEELTAYYKLLRIRAQRFVEHRWREIRVIAAELLRSETLSGREVREVIENYFQDLVRRHRHE